MNDFQAGDLVTLRHRPRSDEKTAIVFYDLPGLFEKRGTVCVGELVIFLDDIDRDKGLPNYPLVRVLTSFGVGLMFLDRLTPHAETET